MLSVKSNLLAMNADRQLGINTKKNTKITEKLSSGYKINRAADDAAGLAISEKMRRQIRGLSQGADNIKDGIGYVQTAEGALNEVHDMLQRINELAVKAANGTNTLEDRAAINSEIQQLKVEMNRIFSTTTFNERKIWDYGPGEQLEYDIQDAVTFTQRNTATSVTGGVTNANCGVLALASSRVDGKIVNGYTVNANDSGIWVTWTGYDGHSYKTDTVKWDDLSINGDIYSFEMSDYFGEKKAGNDLYTLDADGNYVPVFTKTVSFSVNEEAWSKKDTDKDAKDAIIKSINGAKMTSSLSVPLEVDGKPSHCVNIGADSNQAIYISSPSLRYYAAYASHVQGADDGYTFDGDNDSFLVPSDTSGNLKASMNDKYEFTFNMPGIGKVTATPTSGYYYSTDTDDDSENNNDGKNDWWSWVNRDYYGNYSYHHHKSTLYHSLSGTPSSVQDALIAPSGLLLDKNGGETYSGGTMYMNFTLYAENEFTYGDGIKAKEVGSFTLYIDVTQAKGTLDMTYDQMVAEITRVLNPGTVLDFSNQFDKNPDYASIGGLDGQPAQIKVPIYPPDYEPYDDTQRFFVQAGAEAGQHIDIEYEFLNLEKLGMEDTNTLTEEDAGNAINEVKAAMTIVSKQRSDFGAYQNRLEHAYNINNNTVENTQSAESLIRDTDIPDAMMEYSVNNILMQAGVSMLSQANQLPSSVLELLNA